MTELAHLVANIIHSRKPNFSPKFGIILGSGLGAVAAQLTETEVFAYKDLPGFPTSAIEGQKPQLTLGKLQQMPVVCLQGRAHFYEGAESNQILTYVRTLKLLGCDTVIITGAVGSLRTELQPGQIVILKDHINLSGKNPLAGTNDASFGVRFPDMGDVYDREWRQRLEKIGHDLSMPLMEGIYISVLGPSFETPSEIRVFRDIGADVVGMSVVPEVIAARHCGLKVIGLTVVTNLAAGLVNKPQSHEETLMLAEHSSGQLVRLLNSFMSSLIYATGKVE